LKLVGIEHVHEALQEMFSSPMINFMRYMHILREVSVGVDFANLALFSAMRMYMAAFTVSSQ